jgi:hypothetical protein
VLTINTERSGSVLGLATLLHTVPFQWIISETPGREPTAHPSLELTINTELRWEKSPLMGHATLLHLVPSQWMI